MKSKLTKLEKNWILYDVGNSTFTLFVSTIIPIYFNYLAEADGISSVQYLAYWGYAASIVTLIVALIGPVLGSVADNKGYKKPIFSISVIIGCIGCVAMGFAKQWLIFLAIFMIAKIGYSASLIFYDAMLNDVTTEENMDNVSSQGFAWGYIGSCVPFIISLALVLGGGKLGLSMEGSMQLAFVVAAVWWGVLSLPLIKSYKQKYYVANQEKIVSNSFKRLGNTIKGMKNEKNVLWFLIAFFFYIDGVYTIIEMATAYGQALGFDSTGLLLALLLTQFVAFPCSIIFGRLSSKFAPSKLITVCIVAYMGITIFATFMDKPIQFWGLAVMVGMFQGGIQALSRAHFAKIIPSDKSGEYFGILDICGKGASFAGTMLVSIVSQLTGDINKGVATISILFVIGLICFRKAVKYNDETDNPNLSDKEKDESTDNDIWKEAELER